MHEVELNAALAALEELAKKKRPHPTRHHARDLLLPLGELVLAGTLGPDAAPRLARATKSFGERWQAAVREEMQLASAEFVTSIDERYLDMPSYDFEYTSAARRRLEARLRACGALGFEVPAGWSERIAHADEVYAPFEKRWRERQDT